MSARWVASQRYKLVPAAGGLGLVQDFLNTIGIGEYGPDLLADTEPARDWAETATRAWSVLRDVEATPPVLSDTDVARLRGLRATVAKLVNGERVTVPTGSVTAAFAVSDTGVARLEPVGNGWRWLASAIWSEILLSQRDDTWRRLKRCHNPQCPSTFYDRSKNNSGIWHNVKTCGNVANLRASRARRRRDAGTAS